MGKKSQSLIIKQNLNWNKPHQNKVMDLIYNKN